MPSDIRRALLEEHRRLRLLLDEIEAVQHQLAAGAPVQAELAYALDQLRRALAAHNEHETRELETLLRDVDAWGPIRAELMLREHVAEHLDLLDVFDVLAMHEAVARLRAHMDTEERTFLSERVLHDDLITVGVTS
jgi:hypothetical protein